jgi:hypothetical protein
LRPQTADDFRALEVYDDATITGLASVLPGFREGADWDVFAGLMRHWASLSISMRYPRGSRRLLAAIAGLFPKARRLRNGDFAADCPLHEDDQQSMTLGLRLSTGRRLEDGKLEVKCSAGCDPDELLAEVKRRARAEGIEHPKPSTDKGDLDQYKATAGVGWELAERLQRLPDPEDALEALRAFEILARVETKARARKARIRLGRREENELQSAIRQLCWIYEIVTGRPPGRDFDHHKKRGSSPFEKFVAAAIKPLWPNKAGVGRHIRAALHWYKNSHPDD